MEKSWSFFGGWGATRCVWGEGGGGLLSDSISLTERVRKKSNEYDRLQIVTPVSQNFYKNRSKIKKGGAAPTRVDQMKKGHFFRQKGSDQ